MKQHKLRTLMQFALVATLATTSVTSHAIPSVFPTGVTVYDPAAAYNNYVLFSGADGKTHLIDMDGNEVHRWEYSGFPSGIIDPALIGGQRGHVFVQLSKIESTKNTGTSVDPGRSLLHGNKTVGELDWDGNKVWEWGEQAPDHAARQHHDWIRLANGNTLLLANQVRKIPGFKAKSSFDDVIYEVDPKGKIVWQWIASEHLKEFGFSPASLKLVKNTENPDYLHLNNLKLVGPNKWFDAGDKRFAPDNLITDSRNANFIIIIDKKTGKVVWRLGPDYPNNHGFTFGKEEQKLPRPVDQISGQHDAHIIPEGLPGAGNLLVFDNQGDAGYPPVERSVQSGSRILEIDPVKKEIVWEYTAINSGQPSWIFFSPYISDARRLPNGNTLIDEGINGRFFQVTPAGKIVWEYVSPYKDKNGVSSSVYRLQPVPYDWVPAGTPHAENAVTPPANADFRVPTTATTTAH